MSSEAPTYCHFVEGERRVEAPASEIWAVLSDFHQVDRWAPPVTSVVKIGDIARGVGAARGIRIRGLGRVEEVVTVWEEESRLDYRVTPVGPIGESSSTWRLEERGAETIVSLRLAYDIRFGWAGELLHALILRRLLEKTLPGALATLRSFVLRKRAGAPHGPSGESPEPASGSGSEAGNLQDAD